MNPCIVFWTARNQEEAERLSCELLEKQWVACASLIPSIVSLYRWNGAVERSEEVKVIFKTQRPYVSLIISHIQIYSSYEVPEILACDCVEGNPDYLSWLEESLISL